MISLYGTALIFWMLNIFYGNDGGSLHHFWLMVTKSFIVVPVVVIGLMIWAIASYGTRD